MRNLGLSTLLFSGLFLVGCHSTMGPKMPKELAAPSAEAYKVKDFQADVKKCRELSRTPDVDAAKALRNEIAYHVMADIESSYAGFEMSLTTRRATQVTASDMTVLGLTAATGLVGAVDVKDILAATSLAFQGSWQSYDKNFFREKTSEALISQMRASRKTIQAQLMMSLASRDVVNYPWDAVWVDLVDYYYAGTVPSALVSIASTAGAKAEAGTAAVNEAVTRLTPLRQAMDVRTARQKLKAAVTSGDATKVAEAKVALLSILTATGSKPDTSASAAALLSLYEKAMSDADDDLDKTGEKLKALNAAVAAATIN